MAMRDVGALRSPTIVHRERERVLDSTSPIKLSTILCKIITRMKLLFSNYVGGYITVFGGVFELIFHYSYSFLILLTRIQLQENNSPQRFSVIFLRLQLHKLMVFEFKM